MVWIKLRIADIKMHISPSSTPTATPSKPANSLIAAHQRLQTEWLLRSAALPLLPLYCLFVTFAFLQLLQPVASGSCREAQLCCSGRDSSCVVQKVPINAIIEDLSDKPCYCDHACLKLGDCCNDFKDHCGVLDCQVSDWSPWSECDRSCGTGIMSRIRKVVQQAQNGGKHCPSLVQKRGCQVFKCYGHHEKKILREMALLLPATLSRNRPANDSSDIRQNLQIRYQNSFKYSRQDEYCVEFEVLKASKACHELPPYNLLLEGDRISVRCDLEAVKHDATSKIMRLNTSRKHTLPTNVTNLTNGKRNIRNIRNIFATNKERDVGEANNIDDEDFDRVMKTTNTVNATTVTIPTTPASRHNYHCLGEGLAGRITRWSALPTPSCRGKWLRLTVGVPKMCTDSEFIFV